ncbi:MAG: hypothetical protein IT304_04715 [Dehalococcoidia bacterium]|nr:hypothetical protein [Dehalococcoidia bacterium]
MTVELLPGLWSEGSPVIHLRIDSDDEIRAKCGVFWREYTGGVWEGEVALDDERICKKCRLFWHKPRVTVPTGFTPIEPREKA